MGKISTKIIDFFTDTSVCLIEITLGLYFTRTCWLSWGSFWGVFGSVLLFTLGFYGLVYKKLTVGKNSITIPSMIISLTCLVIGMDNSAFIQSDGDYNKALNRIFKKNNVIDISDDINKLDSLPELVFVLDISGSTEKAKINTENINQLGNIRNNIARQFRQLNIEETKLTAFLGKEYNEFTINKLKLLEILTEKENTYGYKINIICFGTECYNTKLTLEHREKNSINPKEAIDFIIRSTQNQGIDNDWTNFEKLLDYIQQNYHNSQKHKTASEPPQYTFLFFSDYLHDTGDNNTENLKKTEKRLEEKISSFYNSFQSFSDFFYFESAIERDLKKSEINVLPIFKNYNDENSKAHIINIFKDEPLHFSNVLSRKCIPIYFSNSYPTDDLTTLITCGNKEKVDVTFILENKRENTINYHQQFSLSHLKNGDREQLFFPKPITIGKDNSLELTFSGRVIDPFSCSTLTCYNAKNGCCRFDIVFFKDFPEYVLGCSVLLFFSLSVFFVSIIFNFLSDEEINRNATSGYTNNNRTIQTEGPATTPNVSPPSEEE